MSSSRVADWATILVVAAVGIAARLIGLGRSLSLDEAWVANSVSTGTLAETLFYKSWLQTSPPLFLILERSAVSTFGLSEAALRFVPLLAGVAAVLVMYALSCRVLAGRWVLLAWVMIALSPPAVEYSKTVKQYSLELLAAVLALSAGVRYMELPTRARFFGLLAAIAIGLAGAYSLAFLVPGLAAGVLLTGRGLDVEPRLRAAEAFRVGLPRSLVICVVSGAVLLWLYVSFVLPNTSPALRQFWFDERLSVGSRLSRGAYGVISQLPIPDDVLRFGGVVTAAVVAFVGVGLWLSLRRSGNGRGQLPLLLASGVPIVVAAVAHGVAAYPVSARTSLFLLPGTALIVTLSARAVAGAVIRASGGFRIDRALAAGLLVVPWLIAATWVVRPVASLRAPIEDFSSAISYLHDQVRPGDTIWVHASAIEGFTVYSRMERWAPDLVRYGATGWPCCPRGVLSVRGSSTEELARQDLDRAVPPAFSGRVWLLYTTRPGHWQFVGVDEPAVQNAALAARGCRAGQPPAFTNVGVSVFDCPSP
jgi:hypothetical protein